MSKKSPKRKHRVPTKHILVTLNSIAANAEHAQKLVDAIWPMKDDLPPVVLQAALRELSISIRPAGQGARLLIAEMEGK